MRRVEWISYLTTSEAAMNRWTGLLTRTVTGFLAAWTLSTLGVAQPPDEEENYSLEEITVTSMRVSAGGARDAKFARGEIEDRRIPHPDAITAEGLLGEHDLTLPTAAECRQLLCLVGEATIARLPTLPHAKYLVELGFTSNVDEATWGREPLNLIAVIDKSGSMAGEPLDLVKRSLRGLIENLEEGDQLGIVLYGDTAHVHLWPTRASAATLPALLGAVEAIESSGSTYMEKGADGRLRPRAQDERKIRRDHARRAVHGRAAERRPHGRGQLHRDGARGIGRRHRP